MKRFVYILILNWNNWQDTIECLESVLRIDYPLFRVIVCDNGSKDGSLQYLGAWAEGGLEVAVSPDNVLRRLTFPPAPKPIPYAELERSSAERGGNEDDAGKRLILVNVGANLGYGGGINVGLRYGLARDDFDYFWLLNNDTVVEPDALIRLVERLEAKPDAGLCGSTMLYYQEPGTVQALGGGTYNKWLGTPRALGAYRPAGSPPDREFAESRLDYVTGSSCLVSRAFLHDIGLLNEEYFIYFEELDWSTRAKGRYGLSYAPDSVVYHRTGATVGDRVPRPVDKPIFLDYYLNKNRLLFARRFYPLYLPIIYLSSIGIMLNRIKRRQWNRVLMILEILLGRCNDWPSTPELVIERLNQL